ncbi:EAL domain-containing protein [Rossellomorea vietnamensis]|uniref:EAL domain-containing protein n=1 Tax=Rossellomorea vietnamensis TaxID=218284 RepID=UPI003CEF870A
MVLSLSNIITNEKFWNVFQPVYDLRSDTLIGYESLFRCDFDSNPELVFYHAKKTGILYELDTASVKRSIRVFNEYFSQNNKSLPFLSVNLYPSTIKHPFFIQFLHKLLEEVELPAEKVILEINEAEQNDDFVQFRKVLHDLKSRGFLIAMDDLGKGNSSLKMVLELEPQIIKFDRYFSMDLSKNTKKQRLLQAIIEFAKEDTCFILEGIETEEDLAAAKSIGVQFGQGYLLGRPEKLEDCDRNLKQVISSYNL